MNQTLPALQPQFTVERYSQDMQAKLVFCEQLIKSGMIPAHFKSPQAAFAVMLRGQELGFAPMQSLEMFHSIQGVPTLKTQAALALCIARGGGAFHTIEESHDKVTVRGTRQSTGFDETVTWTMADAEKAGITGNPTWKKYSRSMLYWRCGGTLAKRGWADVIGGLSLYEEMKDEEYLARVEGVEVFAPEKPIPVPEPKKAKGDNDAQAKCRALMEAGDTWVFDLPAAKTAFGDQWKAFRVKLFRDGAIAEGDMLHTIEPVLELEPHLVSSPGRAMGEEAAA